MATAKKTKIGIYTLRGTTPAAPHYVLMDDKQRYWTGECWRPDQNDAKVYEAIVDAHNDYQALMRKAYSGKPVCNFEATIRIQVHGDEDFDLAGLRCYLEDASHFSQDTDRCGNGPGDTLVLQRADYTTLREIVR